MSLTAPNDALFVKRLVLAFLLLAGACGPVTSPSQPHFVVVVHNTSTYPEVMDVIWWTGSSVVGREQAIAPALSDAIFDMGTAQPDGFQLETTAWTLAWGSPDYRGGTVFEITYPSAASRSSFPTR